MLMLILIIVIIFALGGMPSWGYHSYGWGPSGLFGIILIILVLYLLLGRGRF